jgi:hypothetical protein
MIPVQKRIQAKWALLIMMIGLDGRQVKKPKKDGDLLLLAKILNKLPKLMKGSLSGKKRKMNEVSL